MDQVIYVLEGAAGLFALEDEKLITPAMVNNYVKQKMIPPPQKKKYERPQIAALIVVSLFKRVFSMTEIQEAMAQLKEAYGAEMAYDMFCQLFEEMLKQAFCDKKPYVSSGEIGNEAGDLLKPALAALVGKLLVQSRLAPAAIAEAPPKKEKA